MRYIHIIYKFYLLFKKSPISLIAFLKISSSGSITILKCFLSTQLNPLPGTIKICFSSRSFLANSLSLIFARRFQSFPNQLRAERLIRFSFNSHNNITMHLCTTVMLLWELKEKRMSRSALN